MQIIDRLQTNSKLNNSLSYFTKDFLYFYFIVKSFSLNAELIDEDSDDSKMINLLELKNLFMEKFRQVVTENFNRALSLVKNVEKNAESSGFQKDNIVNINIIQHLINYIKQTSMSFVELTEDFESSLVQNDSLIKEIGSEFSKLLIENYLSKICEKIESVIYTINTINWEHLNSDTSILVIQKFYFFFFILYKKNDVFVSFLNSNISFLITAEIQIGVENNIENYLNLFYLSFLNKITKDVKFLLMNKDFSYL